MKAITLWRPWDQAILHGSKRYENRGWPLYKSLVGQRIALHAGKKYDIDGARWMKRNGLYVPPSCGDSPTGIVGVVVFDKVVTNDESDESYFEDIRDPWFFGKYGWHIGSVERIRHPIPCIGRQGVWNVPDDTCVEIEMASLV